jgi:hypothetical protein
MEGEEKLDFQSCLSDAVVSSTVVSILLYASKCPELSMSKKITLHLSVSLLM